MGAASECYSTPYTGCYYGIGLANAADTSKREAVMRYEIDPTTDFLSVFNHSYAKDGRPVSTSDFDWGDPRAICNHPDGGAKGIWRGIRRWA